MYYEAVAESISKHTQTGMQNCDIPTCDTVYIGVHALSYVKMSCISLALNSKLVLKTVASDNNVYRLRDLESPEPSTSATPITQATNSHQRRNISSHQPQRQTKPLPQSASLQRDKQSTVVAKQRSPPDRKRETAEEAKLREAVMSEVLDIKPSESWNDIAGLAGAKQVTPSKAFQLVFTFHIVCLGSACKSWSGIHVVQTPQHNCTMEVEPMKVNCCTKAHKRHKCSFQGSTSTLRVQSAMLLDLLEYKVFFDG